MPRRIPRAFACTPPNGFHHAGSGGIIAGDEGGFGIEVGQRPFQPADLQRYRARALRLGLVHFFTTRRTSDGEANSPRSASASALRVSSICHSFAFTYSRIASVLVAARMGPLRRGQL